jgi:pimeloyl-ACP methyl ester carboxylesterase
VAGLSFGGILALALMRRHRAAPATLVLASAYAGWAGSLPAEAAAERLRQSLLLAGLSPEEFVATLLPTMFPLSSSRTPVTSATSRPLRPSTARCGTSCTNRIAEVVLAARALPQRLPIRVR